MCQQFVALYKIMSTGELPFAVPKRPPKWLPGMAPFLQRRMPTEAESIVAMGRLIERYSQPDVWIQFHEAGKKRKSKGKKSSAEDPSQGQEQEEAPKEKEKRRPSRAVRKRLDTIERIGREINSPDLVKLVDEIRSHWSED